MGINCMTYEVSVKYTGDAHVCPYGTTQTVTSVNEIKRGNV